MESIPSQSSLENATPFFSAPSRQRILDALCQLCDFTDYVICIIAPQGFGKSAICKHFCETVRAGTYVFGLSAQNISFQQTGEAFLHDLIGLDKDNQGYFLPEKQCVLWIDDAEKMPASFLREILIVYNALRATNFRLHVILSATPAIQQQLQRAEIVREIGDRIQRIDMEPLSSEEIGDYLVGKADEEGLSQDLQREIADIAAKTQYCSLGKVDALISRFSDRQDQKRTASFLCNPWLNMFWAPLATSGLILLLTKIGLHLHQQG